ncbi:MAG: prepilin-type N-terminal cleavage/methylation domain-containing protein [Candidatus Kerfeldbacteria bacterium]|nr:prepilin-type N-terminal cleavage/methylation domain-containing protein [Candidatus Kerfeldbacteria bacterium]
MSYLNFKFRSSLLVHNTRDDWRLAIRGFSLLELIIYIAILAVLLMVIVGLASTSSQSSSAEEARAEVQQNLRFSLDTISSAVRRAASINTPTAGGSGSALSLAMSDGSKNPTVFDLSSQVLRITEGAGIAQALTNNRVKVTSIGFQHLANASPAKPTIQITLTIAYNDLGRSVYQYSKTEQTTVSLR